MMASCAIDDAATRRHYIQFESEKWDGETKANLVMNIVQLVLYHRHQIPSPIEILTREKTLIDSGEESQNSKVGLKNQSTKRLIQLLASLDELSSNLMSLFNSNIDLHEILILLGPTVFSPKCAYCIHFDQSQHQIVLNLPFPKPEVISRRLMLKLATNEDFIACQSFPLTNLSLLIRLPRYSDIAWFLPRQDFKLKSQVLPFIIDISLHSDLKRSQNNASPADKLTDQDTDMIWFQAPISIKGYKDKVK